MSATQIHDPLAHAGGVAEPNLFDLPLIRRPCSGAPAARGSDTSRGAADAIEPKLNELEETVLRFIQEAGETGLTDEEAGICLARSRGETDLYTYATKSTAAARRNRLVQLGRVRDSGNRRMQRSGRNAAVWVTTSTRPSPD